MTAQLKIWCYQIWNSKKKLTVLYLYHYVEFVKGVFVHLVYAAVTQVYALEVDETDGGEGPVNEDSEGVPP